MDEIVTKVIDLAKDAGDKIITIYNSSFSVELKKDGSEITQADLQSNETIINGLKQISEYPIVTEETPVEYADRKNWTHFWLVDPLDGTKDFCAKKGGFTVNIALVENGEPVLGVVYAPALDLMYAAQKGQGAFKNGERIFNNSQREQLIGVDSVFHSTDATKAFFKKHAISDVRTFGSALKICKVAEGEADVYPRLNGTKEWDTAAAQCVAHEAGCKVIDVETQETLQYNKESVQNNHFIACREDLDFFKDDT